MELTIRAAHLATLKTPLLAVPVLGSMQSDPLFTALDEILGGALKKLAREERFKGAPGQLLTINGARGLAATRLSLFGLEGKNKRPAVQLRHFAHRASNIARTKGLTAFALAVPQDTPIALETMLRWLSEGALSGIYRFDRHKTGDGRPRPAPKRCSLVLSKDVGAVIPRDRTPLHEAVAQGESVAAGIALARDLVNEPANELTPENLADRAQAIADAHGLECTIFGSEEINEHGFRLVEAVNRGSSNPPRFIHLVYRPVVEPVHRVALVGKGITFDSGGLSLKTVKGQYDMKCDMAGAAVVLGTLQAAAALGLPVELHGIVPATENMPGGSATRPGDVIRSYGGKTVEVLNTDAEGRLVLADALTYAAQLEPDVIIDHATLTGACMVALGPRRAGVFSSDNGWAARYLRAARRAGEPVWRLPLGRELKDSLKSSVADLKNVGGSWGGAITAALFLEEFVEKVPWIHVDIAGPAYLDKPYLSYPKGGTGFGIFTLLELLAG